jgi:dTDP-4-dehydrorhamnose reductase
MLGRDVVEAAFRRGHEVVPMSHDDLDITDPGWVDDALSHYRPGAVINCAAWTDVDGAEADERGATRINDEGAALLAAAAESVGATVIYPSTDYVFDGSSRRPYLESDLPSPLSAYGRSKLGGETSIAVANPRHLIVRSSWLFGIWGKNFVETMLRVGAEQPEVVVVSDQVGCPTYTRHLARALAAMVDSDEFGIHHVAAAGRCSWFEFAQEIFDQIGMETRVMATTTAELGRPAPRPAFSVLASEHADALVLPDWRQGLTEYLEERRRHPNPGAPAIDSGHRVG